MACQCSVPGSNATIAVTKDDSIRAFSHRWCKATPTDIKVAPLQRTEITKAIIAQLTTTAKSADAKGFIKLLRARKSERYTLAPCQSVVLARNQFVWGFRGE